MQAIKKTYRQGAKFLTMLVGVCLLVACGKDKTGSVALPLGESNWGASIAPKINAYGHRNWIVVADAAYPIQSNVAVKTITIDEADPMEVVKFVYSKIQEAKHIDPIIFLDKEMDFLDENEVRGITQYRDSIRHLFSENPTAPQTMLHEEIIKWLDTSADTFEVLVIKTKSLMPYTSVFFRLECGYWNEQQEQLLRKKIRTY